MLSRRWSRSFLIPYLIGLSGYKLFFNGSTRGLVSSWAWGIAHILWTCLTFGYLWTEFPILSGIIGFEIHSFAVIYIGRLGLLAILSFLFLCFIVIELGWTPEKMALWFQSLKKTETQKTNEEIADEELKLISIQFLKLLPLLKILKKKLRLIIPQTKKRPQF